MRKIKLIIINFLLFSQIHTFAQSNDSLNSSQLQFGLSLGVNLEKNIINKTGVTSGLNCNYSYLYNHTILSCILNYNKNEYLFVETNESILDFGILYGYSTIPKKKFKFNFSTGLLYSQGKIFDSINKNAGTYLSTVYFRKPFQCISIPFKINFDYLLNKKYLIGISLFCNINKNIPFYNLNLHVGYKF